MGANLFSICCPNGHGEYEQIPETEKAVDMTHLAMSVKATDNGVSSFVAPVERIEEDAAETGSNVEQKFVQKSKYEPKFVWINKKKKTIHLSDHQTKDRRHKEASLSEVTSIVAGPPAKFSKNKADELNGKLCLTINFLKGGGIDLKFTEESERDHWYEVLNGIVLSQIEQSNGLPQVITFGQTGGK